MEKRDQRILNMEALTSHGNIAGRKAVAAILEAGFQASDPYYNTLKLIRVEGNKLIVGNKAFEPVGSPKTGDEVFDLTKIKHIYVFGAGKGGNARVPIGNIRNIAVDASHPNKGSLCRSEGHSKRKHDESTDNDSELHGTRGYGGNGAPTK